MIDDPFLRDLLTYTQILSKLDRSKTEEEKTQLTICKEAVEVVIEMYPKRNLERMR